MSTCHGTEQQWSCIQKPIQWSISCTCAAGTLTPPAYTVVDCSSKATWGKRWQRSSLTDMTSSALELIYRTNPVTAGDGNDNRGGSHKAGNRNRQSVSTTLWVTELRGNVSIPFGVSVSLSGSPPLTLSLSRCLDMRAGSVSVRRCVEAIGRWDRHTSPVLG